MLLCAHYKNHYGSVEFLLRDCHVNPNLSLPDLGPALGVATSNNNKQMVQLLFDYNACWYLPVNNSSGAAFHVALKIKDPKLVKLFYPKILAVSLPLPEFNLLYGSVFYENEKAIFFLLENLKNLNIDVNYSFKTKKVEDTPWQKLLRGTCQG